MLISFTVVSYSLTKMTCELFDLWIFHIRFIRFIWFDKFIPVIFLKKKTYYCLFEFFGIFVVLNANGFPNPHFDDNKTIIQLMLTTLKHFLIIPTMMYHNDKNRESMNFSRNVMIDKIYTNTVGIWREK